MDLIAIGVMDLRSIGTLFVLLKAKMSATKQIPHPRPEQKSIIIIR